MTLHASMPTYLQRSRYAGAQRNRDAIVSVAIAAISALDVPDVPDAPLAARPGAIALAPLGISPIKRDLQSR
jgi:hypothetical protein